MLKKLKISVGNVVTRVALTLLKSNVAGRPQLAQVFNLGGSALDDVEYFEPAGFTSAPPSGYKAEGVLLSRAGDLAQGILVVVGARKYRIPIAAGESAIFNTPFGDFVKVRADRVIEFRAAVKVLIDAPDTEFTGDVQVLGKVKIDQDIEVAGDSVLGTVVTSGGVNISDTHTHNENNVPGGPTSAPQ